LEEINMGGSRSSNNDSSYKKIEEDQARQIAEMKQQMERDRKKAQQQTDKANKASEDARIAEEAEKKKQAEIVAEGIRQQKIQAENQSSADFRRQSENKIQSDFTSAAQNQQRLDQQAAQNYASTTAGGSGYNVGSAQQQKISAAGGVAGPASTNAPSSMQMGLPPILASNKGVGGSQQNTNQFNHPSARGLQFGGM